MNDAYDILVNKSVIRENYADKTHDDLRNYKLIPCDNIENFYLDSLFYLHLHFSLYLELLNFNVVNKFDITSFTSLWDNLTINFKPNTNLGLVSTSQLRYKVKEFRIIDRGSGYTTAPNILFTPTGGTSIEVGRTTLTGGFPYSITTNISSITKSSGANSHDLAVNDIITFNTPNGGSHAIGKINNFNTEKTSITEILITERGSGYTTTTIPTVVSIVGTDDSIRTSTFTFSATPIVNIVNTASVSIADKIYTTNGTFTVTNAPNGGTTATVEPRTDIDPIGYLTRNNNNNVDFNFDLTIFNRYYNSTNQYNIDTDTIRLTNTRRPRINNISSFGNPKPPLFISAEASYNKTISANQSVSNYDDTGRRNKFNKILKTIFDQPVNDILGFLAYQVRYYNIIVLNTSIQRVIYNEYLNNNTISMNTPGIFEIGQSNNSNIDKITTHIDNLKDNLGLINSDIKKTNNIYSLSKADYPGKITKLDNNEENYRKTQDALNNTAKNYNQYYNNYNKLKVYASSIIVFLIILIIATIVITILPFFNANSKNTYYILILILLIILTVLFYNNFSHINLYEKFTTQLSGGFNVNCANNNKNTYNINSKNASQNNANKQNNYKVFNEISKHLIDYNNAYSDVNAQMSSSIYTTGNQTFEQDANDYLNSMYIEKRRKIDLFRIKRTSLVNLIEAIKQQIIYLFNIIFIICLLTIVLLIALFLYVNMPQAMSLIITFVSIAIILIIIYYIYAVVQPTRLIANKNYWANKNPSDDTYNKL